jgi:hypothetical protein
VGSVAERCPKPVPTVFPRPGREVAEG